MVKAAKSNESKRKSKYNGRITGRYSCQGALLNRRILLVEVKDGDPHRALADVVAGQRAQRAGRLVDFRHFNPGGFLPGGDHIPAAVVDVEAARLGFARVIAHRVILLYKQ